MTDCPVDLKTLEKLVAEETGEERVHLSCSKSLKSGLSGSGLWLMHIRGDTFRFGVLKVPEKKKEDDVRNDYRGRLLMKEASWPRCMFPEDHYLFSVPLTVESRESPVTLMSFAGKDTVEPATLSALLNEDFRRAVECMAAIRDCYARKIESIPSRPRTDLEAEGFLDSRGPEQMKFMVASDLLDKILKFPSWGEFGIQPNNPRHEVHCEIRASPLFFLNTPEAWKEPGRVVQLPVTRIHGDLNADNIVSLPEGSFVFLDFEKVRPGVPYYDLAFLFMWLIKLTRLKSSVVDEDKEAYELEELAAKLANGVCGGSNAFNTVGHENLALAQFAETLLCPLGNMVSREILPEEYQARGVAMAVVMAALARSFYEFRSIEQGRVDRATGTRNGRFYYDLAGCVLKNSGMIREECLRGKFGSRGPVKPSLQEALKLSISSGASARPSFLTKLAVEIPLSPQRLTGETPGWIRVVDTDNAFGYFSRLDIMTNEIFQRATSEILVWEPVHGDLSLPLLFQLDTSILRNRFWLNPLEESGLELELKCVDLLPLRGGKKGVLGFTFQGNELTLGQYLGWASSREFGAHRLFERRRESSVESFLLSGVFRELSSALLDGRRPNPEEFGNKGVLHDGILFQYLLLGSDHAEWSEIDNDPVHNFGWELVRTLSRTNTESPKYAPDDGPGKWMWTADESGATRYGFSDVAVTAWAHSAEKFNREIKPGLFTQANYFQWFIAREMVGEVEPSDVVGCFTRGIRREFFSQAWRYISRHRTTG